MAIKVGGTSVISDSRVLENVTGLKTVNSTSILGSGNISAGASTTYNAVGTYVWGYMSNTGITNGSTYSGSSIEPGALVANNSSISDDDVASSFYATKGSSSLSGTWRAMGRARYLSDTRARWTLFVRIS